MLSTARASREKNKQRRRASICSMDNLGIDCTLHALRHTHVSQLIAAGMDILTISRRLGHASATITLRVYGHLFANTDAEAAEIKEAAFGRMRTE
jgi:integrase